MTQAELAAFVGPMLMAACFLCTGWLSSAILRRLPDSRLKRILSWPHRV
jgi:hypothetical protein